MFPDGMLPEQKIIDEWLKIVDGFFAETEHTDVKLDGKGKTNSSMGTSGRSKMGGDKSKKPPRIAVHCVAGLGRAPLLVAIALCHKGCEAMNAIELIRDNRPGSLNMI